jgi:CHASE3 domain sensor protein
VNLKQFNSVLRQVFLLPVVALLVLAGALYLQIRNANATVNLIQDSDARISQATLVSKLIVDEESGLRGYETTGDAQFLQPFTEAESHVQKEIQNLDAMAGADEDMKHDLNDLREKHETWHDGFAVPVIAQVRGGGKTNDVDLNLHGKFLTDAANCAVAPAGPHHVIGAALFGAWHGHLHRTVRPQPAAHRIGGLPDIA